MSILSAAVNALSRKQVIANAEATVAKVVHLHLPSTAQVIIQHMLPATVLSAATQGTPNMSIVAIMNILIELLAAAPGIESTVEEAVTALHGNGTNAAKVTAVAQAGASLFNVAAQIATAQATPAAVPAQPATVQGAAAG